MRGNKVGAADLKRLKKDLQAEQERAALAQRVAALRKTAPAPGVDTDPADDMAAFRRTMQSVKPIRQAARVEHKPAPQPAPALRRANALGETSTRADVGVSDGGEITHLLS